MANAALQLHYSLLACGIEAEYTEKAASHTAHKITPLRSTHTPFLSPYDCKSELAGIEGMGWTALYAWTSTGPYTNSQQCLQKMKGVV